MTLDVSKKQRSNEILPKEQVQQILFQSSISGENI